ncbi:MAG: ATP-dependent 6-phosphofructokinase [Rhodothermales bacterium]
MKVGILTGGGDCPGLNAVIRAVSKSLMSRCGAEVYGFEDGFQGLIEKRCRPLEYRDVSGILTRGGTILGTSNRANPFNHLPAGGADVSDEVVEYAHSLGLVGLVAIGGDGTMSIANGLFKKGLNVVGVPKTIDNDLVGTDRTFGFDTAVSIATEALDRLHSTAQAHRRVMICETMGRYAGWIALHAGVASGSDIILIPEIGFDIDEVVEVCRRRDLGGQRYTIVAVAEGAKAVDGGLIIRETDETSPDPIRLGGIGHVLADQIKRRFEGEVRTTVLGHVQRGGTPTAFDRVLASGFGAYAAAMVEANVFGYMVAYRKNRLTHVPLEAVANKTRTVPLDSLVLAAARAVGTSFGAEDVEARFQARHHEEEIPTAEPVV